MINRFSEALKYIRTHTLYNGKIGMSIKSLAKESRVSASYISRLEKPNSKIKPSGGTIYKLAQGLTAKESNVSSETMSHFLLSLIGLSKFNPDEALKISNNLIGSDFQFFLSEIIRLNPNAKSKSDNELLGKLKNAISLNELNDSEADFTIDGQHLDAIIMISES